MAISQVGCGSNWCWLRALLVIEIVTTILCIIALGGATFWMAVEYAKLSAPAGIISILACLLVVSGLHLYFLFLPLRANGRVPVAHHMWRRFSHYVKLLIVCIIVWDLVAIVAVALVDLQTFHLELNKVAACVWICGTCIYCLVYYGILLLLAKNRYQENVEQAHAASKQSNNSGYKEFSLV